MNAQRLGCPRPTRPEHFAARGVVTNVSWRTNRVTH